MGLECFPSWISNQVTIKFMYANMRRGKGQGPRGLSPQHVDLEGGDMLVKV